MLVILAIDVVPIFLLFHHRKLHVQLADLLVLAFQCHLQVVDLNLQVVDLRF
jgi:hypothetical protein